MVNCEKKVASIPEPAPAGAEHERRHQLRAFLAECRANLNPSDLGLPASGRRRVPGLRRDEVAELVGVSADWYRWAETGHVRISPKLIARLASVLRLSPEEQLHLYRLSLPELYQADTALHLPSQSRSCVSPVSAIELEEVVQELTTARQRFLLGSSSELHRVRPRIARSWERSRRLQVDPGRQRHAVVPKEKIELLRQLNAPFLDAARPLLERLIRTLSGSSHIIALSDASGVILELAGDRQVLRRLALFDVEVGSDWSEMSAGTNAIGTTLADSRPLQVIGPEHFSDRWQAMACSAAPVRASGSDRLIGVLNVVTNYQRLRSHLLGYVIECALEIEENFANGYRPTAISDIA